MELSNWVKERLERPIEPPFQMAFEFLFFLNFAMTMVMFGYIYSQVVLANPSTHKFSDIPDFARASALYVYLVFCLIVTRFVWRGWPFVARTIFKKI